MALLDPLIIVISLIYMSVPGFGYRFELVIRPTFNDTFSQVSIG